jgi:HD superfamily phosphodiesterase
MKYIKKFKELNIDNYFNNTKIYITENNITENPYHNNKHILDVFDNSMLLFELYKNEYELKSYDRFCLGIAALFHDFGHSGGELIDSENIDIALDELKKYLNIINESDSYNDIKKIINATEFPHKDLELNILQKMIRDADTMGGIDSDFINIVKSLAKEYGKTLKEFIPNQIKFINTTKFNTEYCDNLLKDNKDRIIEELKKLK